MSDWQAGDLALCLRIGGWFKIGSGIPGDYSWMPRAGRIYTVDFVRVMENGSVGLVLQGVRNPVSKARTSWAAVAFKKITPPTDEEERRLLTDLDEPVNPVKEDA
jgi:hypothetical protein